MRETEEVASKRRALREMQDLLHRANEIVNEVSPIDFTCSLPLKHADSRCK